MHFLVRGFALFFIVGSSGPTCLFLSVNGAHKKNYVYLTLVTSISSGMC